MSGRPAGKACIITGTDGSIGREAALAFAPEGASVVGCDLTADTAQSISRSFADEESGRLVRLNLHDSRRAEYIEQVAHMMDTPPGVVVRWLIDRLAAWSAAANAETFGS